MGIQINFYLTDEDQVSLLEEIRSTVCMVLLVRNGVRGYHISRHLGYIDGDWRASYLARVGLISNKEGFAKLNSTVYPGAGFIEFGRPWVDGRTLKRGRLWYSNLKADPDLSSKELDESREWVHKIYGLARKRLTRISPGIWAGSCALGGVERGELVYGP